MAGNLDTDAMVWLHQQFDGKDLPDGIGASYLRFVGNRIRSWYSSAYGLSAPFLLVGDHPEIIATVREALAKNQAYGLSLAIAAGVTALEQEILEAIITDGLADPEQVAEDAWKSTRLADHYLRDFSSEAGMSRLVETLPAAQGNFRRRLIINLGWLQSV